MASSISISNSGNHHQYFAGTLILTPSVTSTTSNLIPGLPDDIAAVILSLLPFPDHFRLRLISRSWAHLLSPQVLLPLRRRLLLPPKHLLLLFPSDPTTSFPLLLDPTTMTSSPLPPLPVSTHLYGLSNFGSISLGTCVYLIGGSHFDANAFPLNHPSPSAAAYVLDLSSGPPSSLRWARLPDMRAPRGSFACASLPGKTGFMVAGGGSRHTMYPSDGTRIDCVEWYDVASNTWQEVAQMPRYRAGCVGFLVRHGPNDNNRGEDELVVMGGYAEYTTVAGVVPADVYCRDAVALGLRSGKWREIGDMWEQGERSRLGLVTAVENEDATAKDIFMLDANELFR